MIIHPSLTEKFNAPQALNPQRQMGANDPCWCGSGKKWKKCHRERDKQAPVPIGRLLADLRAEMSKGFCLHPRADATTCSPKIIRAHTVQRRGGLAAIAEDGHVVSPKRGFEDIFKNEGQIIPSLLGVRDASTFMGFCGHHDDELFSPIEKAPIILGKEAAFLLSYRAICYELFMKNFSLRGLDINKQMDKGESFEYQAFIQQRFYLFQEGTKRGLRDLACWKREYDAAYLGENFDGFSFYGVVFSEPLPLVACGAFHPEFDFSGNHLQFITRGDSAFEHVCFNLTIVGGKSIAVFGWTGEPNGPSEQFVDSFRGLPKDCMANAAFHLACEHLENTYFRPSWWSVQSEQAKAYLVNRFSSGLGFGTPNRQSDCLARLEYPFAAAAVECEISS